MTRLVIALVGLSLLASVVTWSLVIASFMEAPACNRFPPVRIFNVPVVEEISI